MRVKRTKFFAGAFALAAALGLTAAAFAGQGMHQGPGGPHRGGPHGPGGMHGPGGGSLVEHFSRVLDLTDAQKAQVKQIEDSFREGTKSLHEQARQAGGGGPFDALREGFDESAVRSAAQARANIHVELEVAHARMLSQVYAILTPEQKAKVAELRRQFEQRRPGHPPGEDGGEGGH
jgi:Spy/CpxP family protein refolding chaperone